MNVLKPHLQITIETLLGKGVSQREIERKTGIDRKTIRRYGGLSQLVPSGENGHSISPDGAGLATVSEVQPGQNPPPRPPASGKKLPKHVRSACEEHQEWIEEQVRLGRNAMAIYQDPAARQK